MLGPDYSRPTAAVADRWLDGDDPRLHTQEGDYRDWWRVFEDPTLDALIEEAYGQNLSLRIAATRILQARARLGIAVGNFFPQLQELTGEFSRNQLSRNNATPVFDRRFDFWATGFDAAWELDVWGRFRRGIEAADAEYEASIDSYDDVLVSLLAEVAATYVEMRTFQQRLEFARANVTAQQGSLNIAEALFRGGKNSELDVTQARSNLAQTEALIPVLETGVRQAQNRLSVLLGMPPQNLEERIGSGRIPATPAQVAVGIPAELLRRRPDIRRAEREAAAQSARIGIAVTDLYPHFALAGAINVQAENFSRLFTGTSVAGFVGPSFRWDILNYGRITNNVRFQDARFHELALRYENTVLDAAREAEDALVAFLLSQDEVQHLAESVEASERSVELALVQYREGLVDFNRVFTLQSVLAQQQDELARARGDVARNLIAAYKALGGGWQICAGDAAVPTTIEAAVNAPARIREVAPRAAETTPKHDEGTDSAAPNAPADASSPEDGRQA
jgi:NodT family efflux transporter outer membrane factor (OMF) lipoprotein